MIQLFQKLTLLAVSLLTVATTAPSAMTLERVKAATHLSALTEITIQGDAALRESEARYTITFDRSGRFTETFDGPIGSVTGFDGTTAWEVDWNLIPRVLDLGDRDTAILGAWLWTGLWTLSPDGLEDVRYDAAERAFRMRYGRLQARVVVDEDSGLPLESSFDGTLATWRATQMDYASFDGVMLPTRIDLKSDRGERINIRLRSTADTPDAPYRFRDDQPTNWHFADGANESVQIKQVGTGHMLVRARINGKKAGWFVFDSGAGGTAIATELVSEFDLVRTGRTVVGGAGGAVDAFIYRIPALQVGSVVMRDIGCVGLDLSGLSNAWGEKIAGVIGYDLLARTIVEMSDSPPRIKIYDRASYQLPAGQWRELWLPNRNAAVRASFEGHDEIFKLDTGAAASTVIFHVPAVASFNLINDRETTSTFISGIGGGLPARAGEIAWFEIGGRRFENVSARFATEPVGAFADQYTAGNIGGQIWGVFTLVFDYAGKRIAFLPGGEE